jgi:CRISPR-associated protein Cst2
MNLFATVLTYPAPSANYRGESELNRTVIQKVTDGRFDYPIFSPESMRNALREILRLYNLPSNRERLHDEDQLAVRFTSLPNPDVFADDFFFGYLVAAGRNERAAYRTTIQESRGEEAARAFTFKRDSVLRMNMAKALEPYRYNAVFTQSPLAVEGSAYQNATKSALLHRETVVSAFQFPFALCKDDCVLRAPGPDGKRPVNDGTPIPHPHGAEWTRKLLQAIGELNGVAGNHARSYFEMAPASIVVRLTKQLVAGYKTYGFTPDGNFPEVIDGILHDTPEIGLDGEPVTEGEEKKQKMNPAPDYPGAEFYVGGKIVKDMRSDQAKKLTERGVTLDRDPRRLLTTVTDIFLGAK